MNFYIPELGDQIKLSKDWTFDLHAEYRNDSLGRERGYECKYIPVFHRFEGTSIYIPYTLADVHWWVKEGEEKTHVIPITLPAGTILKIDRIYVRKGAKEFSSVSFYITSREKNKRTGKSMRFWAKLNDCNIIEFEKII